MTRLLEILRAFLPSSCVVCARRLKYAGLCSSCLPLPDRSSIGRCRSCGVGIGSPCANCAAHPLPVDRVRYLWLYRDQKVRDFVRTLKYRPSISLAEVAGRELASLRAVHAFGDEVLVVPIPSRTSSLLRRGFNQCREIAVNFAAGDAPLPVAGVLRFARRSARQSLQGDEERLKISADLFDVVRPELVRGRSIVLIDDVLTTGATACAAAAALKRAGAIDVELVVLAISERAPRFRAALSRRFMPRRADAGTNR